MPQYTTPKGKSFFSETELGDDELDSMMTELDGPDEVLASPAIPEPEENILQTAYRKLSEPLTNIPSRIADAIAEPAMAYGESGTGILNKGALYGGAFLSSLGDVADTMTSPIDLGASIATGGASMAARRGGLALAGKLNNIGRAASALPAAHGISEVVQGNPLGLVEAGLGALGMRGQKFNPAVKQDLNDIIPPPRVVPNEIIPEVIPETIVPEQVIPEVVPEAVIPEVPANLSSETLPIETIPEQQVLPATRATPTLDYSPTSELRARQTLMRAGVTDFDGLSNKQIIEMAEESKPGHQKPKIKVKLDRETNTLVPDNDDPVTMAVLQSAKSNKPVPQAERISPNTEVEFPDPHEMAEAYQPELGLEVPPGMRSTAPFPDANAMANVGQPYFGGFFPELPKSTARAYPPDIMAMMRQPELPGLKSKDAYKQMVPGGKPDEVHDVTRRQEWLSIPRAIQSAYDISFPLRQGIGLVHTKGWWKAWPDMMKSLGDEGAYRAVMDSIAERPNFRGMKNPDGSIRKSFAQEAGLAVSDLGSLSNREEILGSKLAENIPGVRASNRAYTAFANKLRADTFDSLILDAERAGLNPRGDMILAKSIADYVNSASGRGSLGKYEGAATALNNLFFSPRLMASKYQMLKGLAFAPPFVRKQYWKSMGSMVGAYATFTTLNNAAGGKTGTDPTDSEFGRTAIGNTRFDPSGGLLPYITLFARIGKGGVDMLRGNEDGRYNGKYGASTAQSDIGNFLGNKTSPYISTGLKFFGSSENRPFETGDQALRMFTPIVLQGLSEQLKDDPSMAPFGVAQSMIGIGTNTYEKGKPQERLLPEAFDPLKKSDFNIPRSFRR